VVTSLDGDEWLPGNPFRVQVQKNALPVITPVRFDPPWRLKRARRTAPPDVHA
jgi:hypothetical protein